MTFDNYTLIATTIIHVISFGIMSYFYISFIFLLIYLILVLTCVITLIIVKEVNNGNLHI